MDGFFDSNYRIRGQEQSSTRSFQDCDIYLATVFRQSRWAPGHKTILKIFNGMSVSYAINYTTRSNSRNLKSV